MFPALTDDLAHALTSRTHSEGITALAATLIITYRGRILLIADTGHDGADPERWDLPATAVYPGETLTGALDRALATAYHGLELDEITGYVGSYDRETTHDSNLIRHFAFATEIPDPTTGPTPTNPWPPTTMSATYSTNTTGTDTAEPTPSWISASFASRQNAADERHVNVERPSAARPNDVDMPRPAATIKRRTMPPHTTAPAETTHQILRR